MSSREQFEETMCNQYSWFRETLDLAQFHGDDITGYYTGGDYMYHGKSCADALFWAWRGWQESHKQGEAKCAALAAENADLKAICDDRRTFIMNGVQLGYIKVPTVDTDPALETIRVAVSPQEPTPATDAFLAEVRAQGVTMFVSKCKEESKRAHSSGYRDSWWVSGENAEGFAAQLRQEAAQ